MKTFLFQGDSITDAGRGNEFSRGSGYPTMVAGTLGLRHPGEYQFLNRGISGNRIVDVYARIKRDIINLSPDVMSLLIGVNDVWHEAAEQNGVDAEKFGRIYEMLIGELLAALPSLKIILLEPFVLCGRATKEHWEYFRDEVPLRAAETRRVAERFSLPCVSLQDKFDEMCKLAPADYWLVDGVHPDAPGHALIARELCAAFEELK